MHNGSVSHSRQDMLASAPWVIGWWDMPAGRVPRISTRLKAGDILGFWRMRWRIRRMDYKVEPGLYAVGNPGADSPVLVSANYKMSFDILRRAMVGRDAWVLVIDTKGINVWCAAGKGTFCAEEVLRCIEATGMRHMVSRGSIILPQLSATGVRAHELQKRSGYHVVFGPVRAADIPEFLDRGMVATPEMRRVKFDLMDRLVLTPTEFVWSLKYLAIFFAVLALLGGAYWLSGAPSHAWEVMVWGGVAALGAVLAGTVVTPLILPWIPGLSFSLKGFQAGLAWAVAFTICSWDFLGTSAWLGPIRVAGLLLFMPATSAYFALNFTGASTYTSLSGVRKEIRRSLSAIAVSAIIGAGTFIVSLAAGLGG